MERGKTEIKMASEILNRFNKLPTRNQATVLFLGVKGAGKHKIANALLKEYVAGFRVQIRIATSLPLPPDEDDRPRLDFIVFFIDVSNKTSYDLVKSSLQHVDIEYFLGHCCFVVSNVRKESTHTISMQDITRLASTYDSPLLCGEIQTGRGQKILAKKLIRHLGISAGFSNGVTPMLLDATKPSVVIDEEPI